MIRSVTTVPNDLEKEVPSWRVNTPQRVISPIRGIIRLDAYDRKMAWMQVLLRGFSPNGSKVCVHRSPLKTWAITPKTRAIMINTPSNPSGRIIPQDKIAGIAELAKKHDLVVISDEVYKCLIYDNKNSL